MFIMIRDIWSEPSVSMSTHKKYLCIYKCTHVLMQTHAFMLSHKA